MEVGTIRYKQDKHYEIDCNLRGKIWSISGTMFFSLTKKNYNVIEAHCYALQSKQIDCEQLRQFCMKLMKAFLAETSCNQLSIDTATKLQLLFPRYVLQQHVHM